IQKIIEQIDVSSFDEQLEVIPIRFAKAKDIAQLIDQIINKGENQSKSGTFRSSIPRFQRNTKDTSNSNATYFVIPDDRTNTLIVLGNNAGIAKIKKLVSQLDFEIRPEDAGGVYVYYVKHGEAKTIADTLNGLAKQAAQGKSGSGTSGGASNNNDNPNRPATPSNPSLGEGAIFGGEVKLVADEQTNSLIVSASRQDYEVVLNLLSKIDIPRDQVFVEAIIMEMEVNDSLNYGITLLQLDKDSNGVGRAGFSGGNLNSLINVAGTSGLVLGFAQGDSVKINGPNGDIEVKSLLGFIDFLKTVTNTNILSTPQILALDNEEAEIEVGDRIPVARNTSSGNDGTTQNNITFEDATIKLNITPFISPDRETVRLKLDQQVKQASNKTVSATNLASDAVSIVTRKVKSNIVVKNGDTVVIGGLMKDEESPTIRKVPLLGDIPILGWLFKSTNIKVQKQNLLVFMTPKIIRTKQDALKLTDQKLKERLQFVKDNFGGRDAQGRTIERIRKANLRNPAAADLMEDVIDETGEM
ncbi:MAG: type II secretion system secretin GspD, partial [Bdellovibrionales bacterium]|nr:type II secretion system secretin GspD [Bdellovibrionales bacterium]